MPCSADFLKYSCHIIDYWAVQAYKDKHGGVPKIGVAPHHDDFELEEISDDEEEDQDDFNLELFNNEEDQD